MCPRISIRCLSVYPSVRRNAKSKCSKLVKRLPNCPEMSICVPKCPIQTHRCLNGLVCGIHILHYHFENPYFQLAKTAPGARIIPAASYASVRRISSAEFASFRRRKSRKIRRRKSRNAAMNARFLYRRSGRNRKMAASKLSP